MFEAWKQEKAVAALVGAAQDMADRLASAKPHMRDSHAAHARFWHATHLAEGQDLADLAQWPGAARTRFAAMAQTRIAALRKAREYDSSDGLAVWLHTARAVDEPRIAPPVRDIWQSLMSAGRNADAMAADLITDAGLAVPPFAGAPHGFD